MSIENLFKDVKDDIIICGENGGYTRCRDYIISQHFMNKETIKEILKDCKKISNIVICLCTPEAMYVERADEKIMEWLSQGYMTKTVLVDNILECNLDNVIKVSILDNIEVGKNSMPLVGEKWKDKLYVTESGMEWLDFTNKGVNKGCAVKDIQKYLDISPDETMVFGDNHNDLSMIESAEYSFAVKNAREEVLKKAKYITKSNEEDGVLFVLEKVLEGDYEFDKLV